VGLGWMEAIIKLKHIFTLKKCLGFKNIAKGSDQNHNLGWD
jgi:hypothetical protein